MSEIKLPSKKSEESKNPHKLIIFSKPKTGKTTIVSQLPNSLILDLEEGTKYVSSYNIQIKSLDDLKKAGELIKEANYPYKFGIVDTATKLEDLVLPYARDLYRRTPMGKNYQGSDVRTLANGTGYFYLRLAYLKTLKYIYTLFPYTILLGHLKDTLINKKGEEATSKELDLTGKIKGLVSADVDAIAYFYRKENQGILNFNASEEIICGARPNHLKNKEILISEFDEETNTIKTNWQEVFLEEDL